MDDVIIDENLVSGAQATNPAFTILYNRHFCIRLKGNCLLGLGDAVTPLLDFTFFEFHVLADNRVVFFHDHFFRHGPHIFSGDVEKSGSRRAVESDFHRACLGHGRRS